MRLEHRYTGKRRLLESCESSAHEELVGEAELDEDGAVSINTEKKAVQKGSWVRQGPTGNRHPRPEGAREAVVTGTQTGELEGEDHMGGMLAGR